MKVAEKILSLDEYLTRHFEPETELIAGELRPKPLGTPSHSNICLQLCLLLVRQTGEARTFPEVNVRVGDDILIPDICVVRDKMTTLPRDYIAEPPLLCIEVVSPSQRPAEMLAKCERYHEFGVTFCWAIDPVTRRAWEYHSGKSSCEQPVALTAAGLSISLAELFSAA